VSTGDHIRPVRELVIGPNHDMNDLEQTDVDAPQYRIGQAAQLLGVSADTVRRWADAGRLKVTRVCGGSRYVDGTDLARLAVELADEEGRDRPRGQSARNSFRGIVTRVAKDGVAALVEVQSGPHRFVGLITREAADELELQPGMMAKAVVKATNVGIEVAERR
jgi:molybdopterin-binding protein